MPILGVDRERLVRVLQSLIGNAERPSVQDMPPESGTTSMKGTTGKTPSSDIPRAVQALADAPPPDVAEASAAHGIPSKADGAGGANIDQLREIIFGGQMREYEKRFARMEERVAKELTDVREEI